MSESEWRVVKSRYPVGAGVAAEITDVFPVNREYFVTFDGLWSGLSWSGTPPSSAPPHSSLSTDISTRPDEFGCAASDNTANAVTVREVLRDTYPA
ncbi:hypothetical protein [Nocardia carnea]|uniref:hypothetical protein n=1 Tax=Nocardia carnea TaxID=37328 RepID=UPI002454160D|nr:hypothetical protein [Nocardia carnea]